MKILATVVCVVGMLAGSALAQNAVQWRAEDGGNGHWYQWKAWGSVQSWVSAVSASNAIGGHLATLTSAQEELFVRSQVPTGSCGSAATSEALIGLIQSKSAVEPSGGWSWVTGEELRYANWRVGEPNNAGDVEDAGFLNVASGWNDGGLVGFGCASAAIFEWSADCNSDGIVDYGQIRAGRLEDLNSNNIPDCCEAGVSCIPCEGDVSGNGVVDGVDLAAVLGAWGSSGKGEFSTDTNGDGVVDGTDLATVLSGWGPCPS